MPSADSRATDITLEWQELVLPRTAKMTFIVPKGGLEESSFWGSKFVLPPLATGVMQEFF